MRSRAPRALLCASLWPLVSCQPAPSRQEIAESVRRPRIGVCPDLAYTFRRVAELRDRRASKSKQRRIARESLESPFVSDYERALNDWYRVIERVYDEPALSPPEIERSVLAHCDVDERGRAVVRAPWNEAEDRE